ncbi:hypothetical protein EDB81DRAFT_874805 [Dactylonectria macrodidyma]|uniref:NACHT-NTPase and P-loop NTPases N-terminal domain-containing protein n=1 Tax=Dactylonectria macrodidyma TaxID=307937 RepID=A0A9P9JMS9_9HYPO|nr:hypothetical protein EDB81DRAFT_874805 [Dactylonectria macrodidyma]
MLGDEVVNSIAVITTTLRKAAENYETMKDDTDLPPTFHAAGQRPGLVQHALEIVKDQLKGNRLANRYVRANRSLTADVEAGSLPCPPVRQQRREKAVEILMVRIMEAMLVMAEDGAIKDATEA